jgi:thioredoxin-like negative regulator of GroEL
MPPVLAQALEDARQTGAWLLVLAASGSSKECASVQDTLSNAEISAWIETHGSALSFDIEADVDVATALSIRVVPTFIAFKGGEERGRLRGLRGWVHVLMWLHDLLREKVDVGDVLTGKDDDVQMREEAARALFRGGRYAEALEHYVWLWNNMARLIPDMAGVRRSFLARELDLLVSAWRPAEDQFVEIREQAAAKTGADPQAMEAWMDWVVLNSILGDDARTISWFDAVKADRAAQPIMVAVAPYLSQALKLRDRWADIGRLHRDPLKELAFLYECLTVGSLPGVKAPQTDLSSKVSAAAAKNFRDGVSDLCKGLRAAGRSKEAQEVENEALRIDRSEEMQSALGNATAPYN